MEQEKMVNRVVKVGVVFEFYPDTEHEDAFEGMTSQAEIVAYARHLACEDIENLVKYNELFEALRVDVVVDELWATDNGKEA